MFRSIFEHSRPYFLGLILLMLQACGSEKPNETKQAIVSEVLEEIEALNILPKRTYGIVLTAFNRPGYLSSTLAAIKKTDPEDLKQTILIIVDDASKDLDTILMIKEFELEGALVFKIKHSRNLGILTGLMHGFKMLHNSVDYVLNIDSDVNLKSGWLSTLKETFEKIGDKEAILTGFNTRNNDHHVLQEYELWAEKKSIGGINFFMTSEFYQNYFSVWFQGRNRLDSVIWRAWDWFVVGKMHENGFKFYVTKPSVVQHIGFNGLNSNEKDVDIADDFIPD